METYLLTFLGISLSVGLFLFGYRQTVGARKERVRAANSDLERILLRRMVLESYRPTIDGLSRLISGKAQDYRVKRRDVFSEVQLLETLFTRIIESDFITPDQRNEILESLSPVLVRAEEAPVAEIGVAELPSARKRLYSRTVIPASMAVIASMVGALATAFPELPDRTALLTPPVVGAFLASLAIVAGIFVIYRFRESQQETSSETALQSAIDFEQEVGRVLRKTGATSELAKPGSGFDLVAMIGEKKILLEVKAWSGRAPISIIRNLVVRLSQAVEAHGADEAIIVTKAPVELPPAVLKGTRTRIMSLRELRNYLVHGTV